MIPGVPGGWELIIVLVIILLLFGSRKLPELSRSIGKSIVEFKKGVKGVEEEEDSDSSPSTAQLKEKPSEVKEDA